MQFWSWFIACILGVSAIVSPIATAIINNKHQLKLKKIELYEIAKRECLENFIKNSLSFYESSRSLGEIRNFYTCINNLYIYFDDVPESVKTLNSKSSNELVKSLNEIVVELSSQIKTS